MEAAGCKTAEGSEVQHGTPLEEPQRSETE